MTAIKRAKEEGQESTAALLKAFQKKLALASSTQSANALASSRCISHPRLVQLITDARDGLNPPALRSYSGIQLIELLKKTAIICPIPLKSTSLRNSVQIYTIGVNTKLATIPPAEILQAYAPNGVLCYFTAIEYYNLTTQPTPHHHIATLRSESSKQRATSIGRSNHTDSQLSLGTSEFILDNTTYYSTSRNSSNLQSTQRRQINPYCVVNITTLEQTLLDCLHRPRSSGGPAVIFEAWENGLTQTSPERILTLARQIANNAQLRRTAYMIAQYIPNSPVLSEIKQLVEEASSGQEAPTLLPGIPYTNINNDWGLRVP